LDTKVRALKSRLLEINDLESANALLNWDQSTYMPPGGALARARQVATLGRIAHERKTDPELGRLLDDLKAYEQILAYDSDEASLIRVARRDYEREAHVPAAFVEQLYHHGATSYAAWTQARPANDFATMQPLLEQTLVLSRQYASFFPGYEHVADPLIEQGDEGMTVTKIKALFSALRQKLVPLVRAICSQPAVDDACLHQAYPEEAQAAFGVAAIKRYGYDFERGRQDKTHHPFMTKFSLGDVRITTRFRPDDLSEGLFSTLHEAGHALYEQNIDQNFEGMPLAGGTSSGVHESSSRLWENLVGRSLGFWEHAYPKLQAVFPVQLGAVSLDTFYRAINKVQRSLIRTDADEVTYNLHVMMRFDLELDLLEGKLAINDLPEAWRQRFEQDFGITPPNDRDGVLQDVHWYASLVGGEFQGYTLGNLISAQLFEAALAARPEIPTDIARGQFDTLRLWLSEHVYRHGHKFTTGELLERATGKPLTIEPYLNYLNEKYGKLYALELCVDAE